MHYGAVRRRRNLDTTETQVNMKTAICKPRRGTWNCCSSHIPQREVTPLTLILDIQPPELRQYISDV